MRVLLLTAAVYPPLVVSRWTLLFCSSRRETVGHVAKWAETQASKKTNPKELERQAAEFDGELRTLASHLLKVRRSRLQSLYSSEEDQWKKELAAMGLTIERDTL